MIECIVEGFHAVLCVGALPCSTPIDLMPSWGASA
jgi:hypothetical protein